MGAVRAPAGSVIAGRCSRPPPRQIADGGVTTERIVPAVNVTGGRLDGFAMPTDIESGSIDACDGPKASPHFCLYVNVRAHAVTDNSA